MFSSFWRRPTVALTLVLAMLIPVSLIGIQSTASNAQPAKGGPTYRNPACGSGFGETVCITANTAGFTYKWFGPAYSHGGVADITIASTWTNITINESVQWKGSTGTLFVPIKKPDYYMAWASEGPSTYLSHDFTSHFPMPDVGTSNLAITTTKMPATSYGSRYLFRISARGGVRPYSWYPIIALPKGLTLIRTGPKSGTIEGTPLRTGNFFVPVLVHDKVGHAAYMVLWLQVS